MFESWVMDFRYAARRLMRRPTYALLAVLTLALGAGGTAAIFSVVRTLLLDPLPITREDQVGILWFGGSWNEQEFLHLRPNFTGFQRMAAWRPNDSTLETPGGPMRLVEGVATSSEFFDVLGAGPMLGRTFRSGDDAQGSELVAVLSHALWQDLGSDPSIVGRPIQFGGVTRTVIGVMPRGFWFPSPTTRIWTAGTTRPAEQGRQVYHSWDASPTGCPWTTWKDRLPPSHPHSGPVSSTRRGGTRPGRRRSLPRASSSSATSVQAS